MLIKNLTMIQFKIIYTALKMRYSGLCKFHHHATKVLFPLRNRGLVKVSGPQAAPFLQGLITNDMNNFEAGAKSLYAMFLCNRGKLLYDTLIHKWGGETDNVFMLECDKSVKCLLQQHLKAHELKKVIQIEDVTKLYRLWTLIAPPDFENDLSLTNMTNNIKICVYKDPRLADLGHRLISTPDVGHVVLRQTVGQDTFIQKSDKTYKELRYSLGVCEGAEDLFPGTFSPLEANGDYLRGVSFKKGYYIGKDVIDSVLQTGVRNRFMPIYFLDPESEKKEEFLEDAKIWANKECGRNHVGMFKNRVGSYGLGLLNIRQTLEAKTLHVGSNQIEVTKPNWWPEETFTEKSSVTDTSSAI